LPPDDDDNGRDYFYDFENEHGTDEFYEEAHGRLDDFLGLETDYTADMELAMHMIHDSIENEAYMGEENIEMVLDILGIEYDELSAYFEMYEVQWDEDKGTG
jgi:hypothetical protein